MNNSKDHPRKSWKSKILPENPLELKTPPGKYSGSKKASQEGPGPGSNNIYLLFYCI